MAGTASAAISHLFIGIESRITSDFSQAGNRADTPENWSLVTSAATQMRSTRWFGVTSECCFSGCLRGASGFDTLQGGRVIRHFFAVDDGFAGGGDGVGVL